MPYPNDFETKLGFDLIREKLKSVCLSPLGVARVNSMEFLKQPSTITRLLRQTFEFKQVLERDDEFPSSNYFDPSEQFSKAGIEGTYLDEVDFVAIANSLITIEACKSFFKKWKDDFPELHLLIVELPDTKSTAGLIFKIIGDDAVVKDNASAELGRTRKHLREAQSKIRKTIDHSYRQAIEQGWVPENTLPTIRDGRLVIPVYAEHKRRMKGLIIDESATGQTVYIEPLEALEVNNEIRDLAHAEKREVIRILKSLTDELRSGLPELRKCYDFLGHVDFIRSKAKLAIEINATLPSIAEIPTLNWSRAKHPLLYLSLRGKREVVPLSIDLTEHDRMLLVSGPNAGGKSVCLKTVGLLQYMLQCGLLVPVSEDSEFGVFDDILIDIGDQQSIENDLSTYSSHLTNMVYFIKNAIRNSLVLLDELGSGTDPNFGGAIAESILDTLIKKNTWGVATTHYYNLKLFAGNTKGIRNGAMRFDEKNLRPLYQLEIGKPGSSFALEIATNTGLPQETLEHAKSLVGKELLGFEKLTSSLERQKRDLEGRLKELEVKEASAREKLEKYERLSEEIESRKKEIIEKAKQEASSLLKETNKEIEKTIRHIRENQAQKKETLRVRKSLGDLSRKIEVGTNRKLSEKERPISVGDRVRILGQDGSGEVLSIKGKSAIVQFGELKSQVVVERLELASEPLEKEIVKRRSSGLDVRHKQSNFNSTLDIRGKRADEIVPILEQFIDDAILLSYGELRILHGKGEGVLRKVVREQLRKYKEIATAMDEHVERGGDGVTVVVLK